MKSHEGRDQDFPDMEEWEKPGILVMDKDEILLMFLQDALQRNGFRCWCAGTVKQGCHIYRREHPWIDLVLIDTGLTGINGTQPLHLLQRIHPHLRYCWLTRESGKHSQTLLMEQGALRVFSKPFAMHETIGAIRELIPSGARPHYNY